jgi:hypothetical protein
LWYNAAVLTGRLLLALAASAALILSSPFIRDIRDWIRATFPGQYATIVGTAVAVAIGLALLAAGARIRDRRLLRYAAIAVALALGTAYALWNAQGIAEVDAVERVHFVEYGLVTLLFYRVWRPRGDVSMFVMPLLAGIGVGTLEEWLQWFIPGRVGDMRDVFLNGVAIVCGLLFAFGVDPPPEQPIRLQPGTMRRIGLVGAAVGLLFASFVYSVHVGYEIQDPAFGRFRSRYDASTLPRIASERESEWKARPPIERPPSRSREDQYQSEGHLHVQERNRRWAADDIAGAWFENLILEKYYAPVLDAPSYLSKTGHRWPDAQRADAEQRRGGAPSAGYESRADAAEGRHFIRVWPAVLFWIVVAIVLGGFVVLCFRIETGLV